MKTILDQDDDAVPPLHPGKVAVFVLLLGMIAFAGWRFLRAQAAVAAVAEASKDYRKLFPARASEAAAPAAPEPRPAATAAAPASGIGMLKIDDDMRVPKRAPAAEPPPPPDAPPQDEAPPVAAAKVQAAAPVKPAQKLFSRPRLNSGAFSGLNGGSGVGISGPGMGGGGGGAASAAPAMPVIPGMPAVTAPSEKK